MIAKMNLKTLFLVLILTQLILTSTQLHADENTGLKNYAILISKPRHVKATLNILKSMNEDPKKIKYNSARIVLYGTAVQQALKGSDISKIISDSKAARVEIVACSQALKRQKIPKDKLHPKVGVVENAIYEMLRLKTQGYISLDL